MSPRQALESVLARTASRMDAEAAERRLDTIRKLRVGHKFAFNYGAQLVNERAKGGFAHDAEMREAISQWLWLSAENDRSSAEKAEALATANRARVAPHSDAHAYLVMRSALEGFHCILSEGRHLPLVRKQFSNWIAATTGRRAALNPAQRRSIAATQGAFNRRLRKCEILSLQRTGVCP